MIRKSIVVNAYNAQEDVAKLRDRQGDFQIRFNEMERDGITEGMILSCIDAGKVKDRETLFDSACISVLFDEIGAVDVEPETVEVIESAPAPMPQDSGNPFAAFETMITGVVNGQAMPMVENMINSALTAWVSAHDREIQKIKKNVSWTCEERGGEVTGVVHESFEEVSDYISGGDPVLLVGPAGSGKNYTAEQISKRFNLDFYFTSAVFQEYHLTGFIDANGKYHETQFYTWAVNGGLFFFDEMDMSNPEVLKKLNAALGNGYFDFPTGRVYFHKDCRIIGAANTWGTGASSQYLGNELDGSTLDRFMPVWFGYDSNVEESLTDDNGLLDFIRTYRKACADYHIQSIASYRAIIRCDKYRDRVGYEKILKSALLKNLEPDDINMMVDRFNTKSDEWSKAFLSIAKARG